MNALPRPHVPPPIEHDGKVRLYTAPKLATKRYDRADCRWSDLVAALYAPKRGAETMAEYISLPADKQTRLKDNGLFFGGVCLDGVRSRKTVECRTMLTFDADHAVPGLIDRIKEGFPYAFLFHTTRRHTPEHPRYRIIVPLVNFLVEDQHEACGRFLAAEFGIDQFDAKSFDFVQAMMYPTACSDGEYVVGLVDRPWFDPMPFLLEKGDWRDRTRWPRATGETLAVRHSLHGGQGKPPTEKPGIIGAFCRAYPIRDAIAKFLPAIYMASGDPNRYRYAEADSTAGLVIFDDGTGFSHHSTDPAGGERNNSFDLVRKHLYGTKDSGMPPSTPIERLPSQAAMKALIIQDPKVMREMKDAVNSSQNQASGDPVHVIPMDDSVDPKTRVRAMLDLDGNDIPKDTICNHLTVLENDPAIVGAVGLNEFSGRPELRRSLPWNQVVSASWSDADMAALREYVEREYGLKPRVSLDDAFMIVCQRYVFHPVRQYLDSNTWDGIERLSTVLIEYMGAPDTPYTRMVTRIFIVAAVARVRKPGIKFDYVPVLKGEQGSGKSLFLSILGRRDLEFFSDTPVPFDDAKVAAEVTAGKWIIELGEMSGLKKSEVEHMKAFITSQEATFRAAYGRFPKTLKRQCIFVGTTNRDDYLQDPTGNRRFWPIEVFPKMASKPFREHLTPEIVDQIWAEADVAFRTGEKLYLLDDVELMAAERQLEHTALDPRAAIVKEYLARPLPRNWYERSALDRVMWLRHNRCEPELDCNESMIQRAKVSPMEIWVECFGKVIGDYRKQDGYAITDVMLRLPGWTKSKSTVRISEYNTGKFYVNDGAGDMVDVPDVFLDPLF